MLGCKPEEIILHGEISGLVTDAQTNQPLQAASVKLNPANETISTGSDGKYLFKSLVPGDYMIQASKPNYAEGTTTAVVTSANTDHINIALDEIPVIHYSTTALDFGFNLTSLSFTISKTGPGEVAYIFTPSKNWINVNPMSGNMGNETDSIIVTLNRAGLTQTFINEWIVIISTYLQYDFKDTIYVNIKVHNPIIFNPNLSYGTLTDIEGNEYKTIVIGSQTWMAENLRTNRYKDNTPIPLVEDNMAWKNLTTPGYCWYYNDEETYKDIYGALYNWYTVKTGKLCPIGWHVSTDAEWTLLTDYLGGIGVAGPKMQETGTTHWLFADGATNSSGFTGLPGSYRFGGVGGGGNFNNTPESPTIGDWWAVPENDVSEPYDWWLQNRVNEPTIVQRWTGAGFKAYGRSVRCVKD
jgi:uncharacterized protein (TIGR02145 family)